MSAAEKVKPETKVKAKTKSKKAKLKVVDGGKAKKTKTAKAEPKEEKGDLFASVFRMPKKLAARFKKAAKKNETSMNAVVTSLVRIWTESEGF